ncbi:hypothetical protein GCM10025877_31220 [Agromyces mangrovi Wang et al. 2018]|nr:hypothetical protein GCM10025877_31220 [Agromyces mangrovi]
MFLLGSDDHAERPEVGLVHVHVVACASLHAALGVAVASERTQDLEAPASPSPEGSYQYESASDPGVPCVTKHMLA